MARLLKQLPKEFKEMKQGEYSYNFTDPYDWEKESKLQALALETLEKRAIHVWTFPMADSCAYYEVAKLNPVQLKWIPFCDQWEAPDYVIRGLQTKDVMQDIAWKGQFKDFRLAELEQNGNT